MVASIFASTNHRIPFYTIHLSGTWMVVHLWSNGAYNGAQVQIREEDGPYSPIRWGKPW